MRYFVFVLFLLLSSCNSKEKEISNILKYWKNREMYFPVLNTKIAGRDTLYNISEKSIYKIVHYIDSLECIPCKLNLYEWVLYMKEVGYINPHITCIFILSFEDSSDFEELRKENGFKWPVMYDPHHEFNKLNVLPIYPNMQTFLLDEHNKVVAIGDPVKNKSIQGLYLSIVGN